MIRELLARVRSFVRAARHGRAMNEDVQAEFGFHIAARADDLVRSGVPRRQAERRARLEFGSRSAYAEHTRAVRGVAWLDEMRSDMLYAYRQFRGAPVTYAAALAVLAIPFALQVTAFAFVDGVVLRPLPLRHPERVIGLWERPADALKQNLTRVSPPVLARWQAETSLLETVAGWSEESVVYTDSGRAWRLPAAAATPELFTLYGHPPLRGRWFTVEENLPGAARVVVLSHHAWSTRFARDTSIVGRAIRLDGVPHEVVGIASPAMAPLHGSPDLYVPLAPYIEGAEDVAGAKFLLVAALLRDQVDPARVQATLDRATAEVAGNAGWAAAVVPLREQLTRDARSALVLLFAAGVALMFVAVVNVSALLLCRLPKRAQELGMRRALGASGARLLRQMLVESVVLGAIACAAGFALAHLMLAAAVRAAPATLPRLGEVVIDGRVVAFGMCAIMLVVAVIGVVPGLAAARATRRVSVPLHTVVGRRSPRAASSVLTTLEIAGTFALVGAALLLLASFRATMAIDPGFSPDDITTADLSLATHRFTAPAQWAGFADEAVRTLTDRLGTPVAASNNLPISGRNITSPLVVEGTAKDDANQPRAHVSTITPGFFSVLEIQIIRGRGFTDGDREDSQPVAIISRSLALQLFPGVDPIGRRLRSMFGRPVFREIVGIVDDVHHTLLTDGAGPVLYVPFAQDPKPALTLVVRSERQHGTVAGTIAAELRRLEPEQPITRIATMDELLLNSVARLYFVLRLVAVFAALGLLVALSGIYATMIASVEARRGELAVRGALGARAATLLIMVLRDGARIVLAGIALGVPLILVSERLLDAFLYDARAADPVLLLWLALLVAAAALLGMLQPAFSASRTDPASVLRA